MIWLYNYDSRLLKIFNATSDSHSMFTAWNNFSFYNMKKWLILNSKFCAVLVYGSGPGIESKSKRQVYQEDCQEDPKFQICKHIQIIRYFRKSIPTSP
jgi:hypothetical protein